MSDRHAAEKLFSRLLADYREDILPDVVFGWDNMSRSQKSQYIRMNNFFCGLHFLVGLADSAKQLSKYGNQHLPRMPDTEVLQELSV